MDLILEFGFTHLENLLPFLFSFLWRVSYSSEVTTCVNKKDRLGSRAEEEADEVWLKRWSQWWCWKQW